MTLPVDSGGTLGHTRVVIVGAGRSGLALADALIRQGLDPQHDVVILEAGEMAGSAWQYRSDQLRLLSPARHFALPGLDFPGDPHSHPTASVVLQYLSDYAAYLGVRVMLHTAVVSVSSDPHGHGLIVATSAGSMRTRNVVAATGRWAAPRRSKADVSASVAGVNVHSADYLGPAHIPEGSVLVVGDGDSGREIVHELAETREVILATRGRRWDTSVRSLKGAGVRTVARIVDVSGARFCDTNGTVIEPTSVIWATGYDHGFGWLPPSVLASPKLSDRHGTTAVSGLFVLGFRSTKLRDVDKQARRLAREIDSRP